MKNLLKLCVLALFSAFLFSCSSDDDNNTTVSLEGTWLLTAFNLQNNYDLNNDGMATNSYMDETNCHQNETLVFGSDNTGVSFTSSFAEITIELGAGSIDTYEYSSICVLEDDTFPFSWSQNGGTVTLLEAGTSGSLSGSQLTFIFPNAIDIDIDSTTIITEDVTFIYTKQ